jgi:hypothetical protein
MATFVGFDNTYATTTEGRGSPIPDTLRSRSRSPAVGRNLSPSREVTISAADVDPEAIRNSLRDWVQHLASVERERVSDLGDIGIDIGW